VDDLPQGFFKVIRQPDKATIRVALDAKQEVPGAALILGSPSLSIRNK
jgi:hypothetical protein